MPAFMREVIMTGGMKDLHHIRWKYVVTCLLSQI